MVASNSSASKGLAANESLFVWAEDNQAAAREASRDAYRDSAPARSRRSRQILARLREMGDYGQTRNELADFLSGQEGRDVSTNDITSAVNDLRDAGLVAQTSQRRPTSKGKTATVLVAKGVKP